jgi:P-type Cu+ transporter
MTTRIATTHTDPVCGMQVQEDRAAATSVHNGTTYFFCSQPCKTKFDNAPAQFLPPAPAKSGCCCCG